MECRVYKCIENTDMETCAECNVFPCEYLHPYRDQAEKWHNTKVYNLCRIKKLGLEKWAKEEAGGVLDKYFYGTWTLFNLENLVLWARSEFKALPVTVALE
jgi:hypothetical protein